MTNGIPDVQRRPFLSAPGERLLMTNDPVTYIERFEEFAIVSGIPEERILAMPLIATPLPVPIKAPAGGLARWTMANPSFFWHPLMWLPERLALRAQYRTVDPRSGGTSIDYEVEPDDTWAIRVVTALSGAGLYDAETGTWLDVLAYFGLNINDPVDYARVERWVAGDADNLLDAIDLSEQFDFGTTIGDEVQIAADLAASLVPAQWSITAARIAELVLEARIRGEESLPEVLATWGAVAAQALRGVPVDPATGEDIVDVLGLLGEAAAAGQADPLLLCDAMLEALSEVATDYRPALDAVAMAL